MRPSWHGCSPAPQLPPSARRPIEPAPGAVSDEAGGIKQLVAGSAQAHGEQCAARQAQQHVQHRGIQRGHHGNHHEEQHAGAERSHQRDPGLLPANHAPEQVDGNHHRDQQQLRQHAHHHAGDAYGTQIEGQSGDRAADHRACEETQEHQHAARDANQQLGGHVVALPRADGEDVLRIAALEVLRNEDTDQHGYYRSTSGSEH